MPLGPSLISNFVIVLVFIHVYDLSSLSTKKSTVKLERWEVLDLTKHSKYLLT